MHVFFVSKPTSGGARWSWDGNVEAPTFQPSMKITFAWSLDDPGKADEICHYFLYGVVLKFCADSTHALRGQSINLPDLPEDLQ